ncbi:MAG: hypothetical protein KBC46_03315 [Ferrovibrio sp.]|nr:hypothetical protein [Ferrovibrio sp.]
MLNALDRWDEWREMRAAPKRIADLEARMGALEAALAKRPPAEACPICGGEMKITKVVPHRQFGAMGLQDRLYACQDAACGHSEQRMHDPNGRLGKKG